MPGICKFRLIYPASRTLAKQHLGRNFLVRCRDSSGLGKANSEPFRETKTKRVSDHLDFQWDAGTRAPSILLLSCTSKFMGLPQHLVGSSQPVRRTAGCSQALDFYTSVLHFSWFPLLFQVTLGQCHLCQSPTQPSLNYRFTKMLSGPPSPFIFFRSSASGSASQVLCS